MIYQINRQDMPSNSQIKVGLSDLDNSNGTGRTESGYAFRDRIRKGVRQLEVSYTMLTDDEIATLLNALEEEFFIVKYKDPQYGITEKTFYVSDRSAPMEYMIENTSYWELTFSLIEQ